MAAVAEVGEGIRGHTLEDLVDLLYVANWKGNLPEASSTILTLQLSLICESGRAVPRILTPSMSATQIVSGEGDPVGVTLSWRMPSTRDRYVQVP